ncbi:MAG: class I tRNA ligase family protein, partial [Chloroflexi bacterium]|nr:class I tRNA ligase family protein [Chloroflexota bacterium]
MTFKEVPVNVDFVAQEHEVLGFWGESQAFEKCRRIHKGQPHWSFIDGPITANNPMGVHHGWGRAYKDLYHRFWTMRGREARYQNGFDCQGLWVEVEVEKELEFASKKDIEAYGLADFVMKCKERVLRYAALQTEQSIRLGYWMDWNDPSVLRDLARQLAEDPQKVVTLQGPEGQVTDTVERMVGRLGLPELGGSYFTFSTENNYMIWTFLKKCWQKGWLYRGADVMPWCPRCATGISQHEIVTDGYQELTHKSVTLRFPLRGRDHESLLVWTTTPWTLSSNVAAAVGPQLTYVKVRNGDEVLYLSKGTLHILRGDYTILAELKGSEMEGWAYDGPFDELEAARQPGGLSQVKELQHQSDMNAVEAHRVILWEDVGEEEGTGIVHIAPGCGAEDFQLSKSLHLPLIAPLDEEGVYVEGFGWLTGKHVSEVNELIFADLKAKGVLYQVKNYTHRYPVCWRCKTELVFRLVDEWFIRMDELRRDMIRVTEQIRWIPPFGLERELDWLRNMHDWMISKKRYWGLALPFWECPDCHHVEVIGDESELAQRAVAGWEQFAGHTPHRPYVDAVKIACPKCGGVMSRIADVGNPWLDAGIVSFSTLQYRGDHSYWEQWFPANWISESFPGQFRNWFYSLLAMATVIENKPPFLQCFGYSTLYAEDGRPMHKSWGNSIEFNEAADKMGVDVMRWMYCNQNPEANLLFGYNHADETRRRFLIPLWNIYSFFISYAVLDKWQPANALVDAGQPEGMAPASTNLLDRWIMARLNEVIAAVTQNLEDSDAASATTAIEAFIDDLSNWYIRRSRRRFWKSEHDADKQLAYATLYYVLIRLTKLLAPFTPFVTEVMYQNLVRSVQPQAYESVHHCDWPEVDETAFDSELVQQMSLARAVASLGLGARGSVNIKVRQPLAKALVFTGDARSLLRPELVELVKDELNVKEVEFAKDETELVKYQLKPENRSLGPKFGARFPQVRKALASADAGQVVRQLRDEGSVILEIEGEQVALNASEVLIETQPVAGLAITSEQGITVAIDSIITPELRDEGTIRDLVRAVQSLRKDADYQLDQRIVVGILNADDLVLIALRSYGEYLRQETLAVAIVTHD